MVRCLMFVLTFSICCFTLSADASGCDGVFHDDVEDCTKVTTVIPHTTLTQFCEQSQRSNLSSCINMTDITSTCRKNFRVSLFNQQLFAITMKSAVREMLSDCCEGCAGCSIVNQIEDVSQFSAAFKNKPDIIFPIVSKASISKLHGFHFIPSFNVPSSYYFTLRKSSNQIIKEVIRAILNLWPLFLVCVLMALLSGFVIWCLELRKNKKEFPRQFYVGIFEGFWWSFVSMTTVGYGDKVPKSFLGRLYSVIWILIGITMCSIFTASLITEIINAKEIGDRGINGKRVGVLKGRLYDIAIVAEQGGVLYQSSIYKTMRGINELLLMTQNKSLDGFVIDRNTFYHFQMFSREKEKHRHIGERFKSMNMLQTEKFGKEELQCGVLIKSEEDYDFFKPFFVDYRIHHESCNSLRMNTKEQVVNNEGNVFATDSDLFYEFLYYMLGILGAIFAVGTCVQVWGYYSNRESSKKSTL